MTPRRVSPSIVVAAVAVLIAVSSGSAVAATLITGKQIKDRSLTAVDIAKNTLTGVEINESKLGPVPNSNRLGGLPGSAFLRSTRIESGTVDFNTFASSQIGTVFTDARLGLRIAYQQPARLYFDNLNTTATVTVSGVGFFGSTVYPSSFTIPPQSNATVVFDATGFVYGNFLVTTQRTPVSATSVMQLTCAMDTATPGRSAFSCVGVS
jgi:hypothetical protein